jgi:hypothetical protein
MSAVALSRADIVTASTMPSRHLRTQMPALGRVERLQRRLGGCELKSFDP